MCYSWAISLFKDSSMFFESKVQALCLVWASYAIETQIISYLQKQNLVEVQRVRGKRSEHWLFVDCSKFKYIRYLSAFLLAFILLYQIVFSSAVNAWSLTLREEGTLRVFENRTLKHIFRPKRDENWEWKILHNEKVHILYRSPNLVRVIKSRMITS